MRNNYLQKQWGFVGAEPCQRCGGRGYIIYMMRHPRDGLIEDREICGCKINADLPIPEIENGRLGFTLKR